MLTEYIEYLKIFAMYQRSDMQSLDIVTACRDALYAGNTHFPDDHKPYELFFCNCQG